MIPTSSHADSQELASLRWNARLANPNWIATPYRLGLYAAEKGIKVTDFGQHSKRWIKLFNEGYLNETAERAGVAL